jgi:hypothetical protein
LCILFLHTNADCILFGVVRCAVPCCALCLVTHQKKTQAISQCHHTHAHIELRHRSTHQLHSVSGQHLFGWWCESLTHSLIDRRTQLSRHSHSVSGPQHNGGRQRRWTQRLLWLTSALHCRRCEYHHHSHRHRCGGVHPNAVDTECRQK